MDLTWVDRALGSNIPYITYAVPVFFVLIGVELVVALYEQKKTYRLHDSLSDLSCGITEQMVGIFLKGALFAGYLGTYGYATRQAINLVDVSSYSVSGKWLAAIFLFLGVDCAYMPGAVGSGVGQERQTQLRPPSSRSREMCCAIARRNRGIGSGTRKMATTRP